MSNLLRFVLAVIVFILLLPLLSVVTASIIADIGDCRMHEGSAQSCIVWGEEWGETLYRMFVLGWLGVVTVMPGLALAIVWAFFEGRLLWHWYRQHKSAD